VRDILRRIIIFPDVLLRREMTGESKSALPAVADRKELPAGEVILTVEYFFKLAAAAKWAMINFY